MFNTKLMSAVYPLKPLCIKSIFWVFSLLAFSSCQTEKLFKSQNPYTNYLNALDQAGLENFGLGKKWVSNGEVAMANNLDAQKLPHAEMTYFDPAKAEAFFWRYEVKEGSKVSINAKVLSDTSTIYFLDVFRNTGSGYSSIHFSSDHQQLGYTVQEDEYHLLRVQPELLGGGMVEISIEVSGSIVFPISEMRSDQVASFWGDIRGGGTRTHEGVDVFAKRGTPVKAVVPGRVSRTGQNRLGGNVVWLNAGRYNFYYAHLDSQLVQSGQKIELGDTLGTVGNTGNARTTAPHLHFGIYRRGRGAIDPFPFLQMQTKNQTILPSDSILLKNHGIFSVSSGNLRASPGLNARIISKYSKRTYFDVLGKSGNWFRIKLPDDTVGFAHQSILTIADKKSPEIEVRKTDLVFENWEKSRALPLAYFAGEGNVLGHFKNMAYVQLKSGLKVWMPSK